MTALVRLLAPARWGLRHYRATAALLAATTGVMLGATLPVAWLSAERLAPRLVFSTVRPGEVPFPPTTVIRTAADTQAHALARLFAILLGLAALVLAVGGLTIFVLSLVRARRRAPEVAIRRAVGASRRVILGSTLVEVLGFGAAGVALGIASGSTLAALAVGQWPGTLDDSPGALAGLCLAGALLVLILGALLPLLFAPPRRVGEAFDRPLGLGIPILQLAMCLVVLSTGALLVGSAPAAMPATRGAAPDAQVLELSADRLSAEARAERYASLLDTAASAPGGLVSLASSGTLVGLGLVDIVTTDCGYCWSGGIAVPWHREFATYHLVSADTFEAVGARLLEGRLIEPGDRWQAPRIAVVNRRLAREHFQDGRAIGRDIFLGYGTAERYRVVGVVDDGPAVGFGAALQPPYTVYLSVLQNPPTVVDFLSSGGRARDLAPGLAGLTLGAARPVSSLAAREQAPYRWFARWVYLQGWAALAIATVGTFVVMRLWVLSHLAELGVRRAVGAGRRHVIGFVLLRALGAAGVAALLGLWFAQSVWGIVGATIEEASEWHAAMFLEPAALLTAVALAGALFPAWQAARRPPVELVEHVGG